jgi:hypothetical protein
MFNRKNDVVKFFIYALVIALGMAIHTMVIAYLERAFVLRGLYFKFQQVWRGVYVIILVFLIWNLRAFSKTGMA